MDGIRPTIEEVRFAGSTYTSDGILTIGEKLSTHVDFNEDVVAIGKPQLRIDVGGTTRLVNFSPIPPNNWRDSDLHFVSTVVRGDLDLDGVSIEANALSLNGSTIKDTAGNDAVLTHEAVAVTTSGNKVDGVPPTTSSIAITSDPGGDDTYDVGDLIEVTVSFTETVSVPRWQCTDENGQPAICMPRLVLNVGGVAKTARTPEREGITGTALVFSYSVRAGDNDANGISIGANAVTDHGTVRDNNGRYGFTGNDADLTHAALADDAEHKVDTKYTDATLSALTLSGIDFGTFTSGNTEYSDQVANGVTETTVTSTLNDSKESYVIYPGGVENAPAVISLQVDSTILISIRVTAEYGETTRSYFMAVTTRAYSTDATLSSLSLSDMNFGTFASGTTSYTASVANSVTETTVTPTLNNSDASYVIKLGGLEDSDGVIPLSVGSNVITIEVTAEDDETTNTYTAMVTRSAPPSTDATLSALTLSGVNFGTFASGTTSYTADVTDSVTDTTVTSTVNHSSASYVIKLGGVVDLDGTVSLTAGENVITVEVTAEDGQTTKTYTVTVTRLVLLPQTPHSARSRSVA